MKTTPAAFTSGMAPEPGRFELSMAEGDGTTAEFLIYGYIGGWEVDAAEVAHRLTGTEVDTIRVRINSPGGSAFDGVAIMNALTGHKARVVVEVDGLAASAASIIAMAGDEVVMRPGSQLMIHESHVMAMGEAADLRKTADILDSINASMAQVYADRTGGTSEAWREAMSAETWFTADEAVEAGLADRVDRRARAVEADAEASFDLSKVFAYAGRGKAPAPDIAALRGTDKEEVDMDFIKAVAREVGTDTDDAETVLAALREALAEQAEAEAEGVTLTDAQFKSLAEAVDMTADDDPGDVVAEAVSRLDATSDDDDAEASTESKPAAAADAVTLDEATYQDLLDRAAAGDVAQSQMAEADAGNAVDAAVDDGRVLAARRADWIANFVADPVDTAARLAALAPGRINRAERGHARSSGSESDSLTARAESTGLAAAPKL